MVKGLGISEVGFWKMPDRRIFAAGIDNADISPMDDGGIGY